MGTKYEKRKHTIRCIISLLFGLVPTAVSIFELVTGYMNSRYSDVKLGATIGIITLIYILIIIEDIIGGFNHHDHI